MSKEVLDALCRVAETLSIMFGKNCETIVHDFSCEQCRIVAIYNSHISGRSTISTDSIYGKSMTSYDCKKIISDKEDIVNTLVNTPDGRHIKTSSVNFSGDGYHYVLGINFDSTAISAMSVIINDLLQAEQSFETTSFADKKLSEATDYAISVVNKPVDRMSKSDRMRVVALLDESGVFSFQRAVPYVSERLDVSRYTVYNYLNEIRGGAG